MGRDCMTPQVQSAVTRAVRAFALAGAAALVACVLALPTFPLAHGAGSLVAAVAIALAVGLLIRFAIRVPIRGETVAIGFEEVGLVACIVLVSPALAPIVAVVGAGIGQLLCRRDATKTTFNVAQTALSAAVGAGVAMAMLAAGAPLVAALLVAPLAQALVSHLSVASILARVEGLTVGDVLAGRMTRWAAVTAVLTEAAGLTVALVA